MQKRIFSTGPAQQYRATYKTCDRKSHENFRCDAGKLHFSLDGDKQKRGEKKLETKIPFLEVCLDKIRVNTFRKLSFPLSPPAEPSHNRMRPAHLVAQGARRSLAGPWCLFFMRLLRLRRREIRQPPRRRPARVQRARQQIR